MATPPVSLRTSSFTVQAAIKGLNINMSDGRQRIDGTWQDKLRIYEDTHTLGEIRAGHEREDLAKLPVGTRCYATYLPSQNLIRWASSNKIQEALGGSRHDYVNRGDALDERNPRRGYIIVQSNGTVRVST